MSVIAVYNMKGGVGKTTTVVNLAYLAAAAGQRVLLWDLDPQGAASFAFRVRPRVKGFDRKSLDGGDALGAAIKETDYPGLDLLPADFAYRKLDRFLDDAGEHERVVTDLLSTLGRSYDVVFLDCPPGFSLLIEGIFFAVDVVLVPAIPTMLSLRTVERVIKWSARRDSPVELAAFFNMVDRRKALHGQTCDWSLDYPGLFLTAQIPYASVVEQVGVRRMPLLAFAPRSPAAVATAEAWSQLQARLHEPRSGRQDRREHWAERLKAIQSLIARLEPEGAGNRVHTLETASPDPKRDWARRLHEVRASTNSDPGLVHGFDTERRDLERSGYVLELRERTGHLLVVAAQVGNDDDTDLTSRVQVQIDASWAVDIFSGAMSPLEAFDRRLGRPGPRVLESIRAVVGRQELRRIDSRLVAQADRDRRPAPADDVRAEHAEVQRAG